MSTNFADLVPPIIVAVYLCALLWLGRYAHVVFSRHTATDYFLASRTIGPFLLVMSIFGTTMTAFALVGSSGKAFEYGIGVYGLMASWSGIVHSACFFLIGVKLWSIGKRLGFTTQIQYFRHRFESPMLALILFPILVGLVIPYLLIGIIGGGVTIEKVTAGAFPAWFAAADGGIPVWLGSGMICTVVLIYVFGGGLRSTAWANALQTCVFMALGVITFFVIADKVGGLQTASQAVAEKRPDLLVRGPTADHPGHISHLHFLSYVFIPLSVAMFPHLFQHWMTAKSARTFRTTVILHPIFIMIVWVPCVLLGVWASSVVFAGQPVVPSGIKNPNAVLGIMVAKLTNPYLTGLLTVGILAAIMSSLDSQFLCIGSMFTHDIVIHHFGENRLSDRQRILVGRSFVVGIVVTAYLLSLVAKRESVFDLGVWCFSGFASLFPLVFASLYWRRVTKAGAIASILTAAAVWAFLFFWLPTTGEGRGEHLFLGMMPVATIFAAATAALVLVSLVTRPPRAEVLSKYFG